MDNIFNAGPFIGGEIFAFRHKDHASGIIARAVLLSCFVGAAVYLAI